MARPPWLDRLYALPEQGPESLSVDDKIHAHLLIEGLEPGLREGAVPDNASLAIKLIKMRLTTGLDLMLREQREQGAAIQGLVTAFQAQQREQIEQTVVIESQLDGLCGDVRALGRSLRNRMMRADFPAVPLSSSWGSSATNAITAYNPADLTAQTAAVCNVSGRVWNRQDIKGAHLFHLRWSSQCDVLSMCGVEGINNPSNMLLMHTSIKGRYDKMQFTLLPDATPNTYTIKVLDHTLKTGQSNTIQKCPGPVYNNCLAPGVIQQWRVSQDALQASSQRRDVQAATASPAAAQAPGQQVSEAGVQEGQEGRAADSPLSEPPLRWSDLDSGQLVFATDARPSAQLMYFLATRTVLEAEANKWIQKGSVVVPKPGWLSIKDTARLDKFLNDSVLVASSSNGGNSGNGNGSGLGGDGDSASVSNTDVGSVDTGVGDSNV